LGWVVVLGFGFCVLVVGWVFLVFGFWFWVLVLVGLVLVESGQVWAGLGLV